MEKISLKTESELRIMAEGGRKLKDIKKELGSYVNKGVSAAEIERKARELIKKAGGRASFMMVPGYKWATCINVNEGLVHGIPKDSLVFKSGDIVSIDVGMFYRGFHIDTSFTVGIAMDDEKKRFLKTGRIALKKAIQKAVPGARISEISQAIEKEVTKEGYSAIRALVGHGVGRELHEEPQIPCFVDKGGRLKDPVIVVGMALAIEVMYAKGDPEVKLASDGWTISMADGKISGLFEETVAIYSHGPIVLT